MECLTTAASVLQEMSNHTTKGRLLTNEEEQLYYALEMDEEVIRQRLVELYDDPTKTCNVEEPEMLRKRDLLIGIENSFSTDNHSIPKRKLKTPTAPSEADLARIEAAKVKRERKKAKRIKNN